ncbi:SPT2 chromatin protein-domain-containing protein [Chytriomyces sp. MP71]|nr:SPT2 chromatin protein-domain-containing protein [Chytriomyces sp. MP71]
MDVGDALTCRVLSQPTQPEQLDALMRRAEANTESQTAIAAEWIRILVGKKVDPRKIPVGKGVSPRKIPVGKEVGFRRVPASKETDSRETPATKDIKPFTSSTKDTRILPSTSAPKKDSAVKDLKRPLDDGPPPGRKRNYHGVTGDDIWSILAVKRRPVYYDDDSDEMEVGFSSVRAEESRSAKLARLEEEEEERREKERLRKKGKLNY